MWHDHQQQCRLQSDPRTAIACKGDQATPRRGPWEMARWGTGRQSSVDAGKGAAPRRGDLHEMGKGAAECAGRPDKEEMAPRGDRATMTSVDGGDGGAA